MPKKKDLSMYPGHEKDYEPDSYETQGMAVKLKEHDEELKKYKTYTYPCESHKVWCCGGSQDLDEEPEIAALYPYTLASEAQRRDPAATRFDWKNGGCCSKKGVFRVVILDREEEMSTEIARKMMPTLCEECCQLAVYERIFREILSTQTADQMEQEYDKQMEALAKKEKLKGGKKKK
jgi:hypothetical protein